MMRRLCALVATCLAAFVCSVHGGWINPGTPVNIPPSFDCAARQLMYEYGEHLLPSTSYQSVYDALQLQNCPSVSRPQQADGWRPPSQLEASRLPSSSSSCVYYVDPKNGDDVRFDGESVHTPLRTIEVALKHTRNHQQQQQHHHQQRQRGCSIVLRQGTHYLSSTLVLDQPQDSGLTIRNYKGERAVISGAKPLPIPSSSWKPYIIESNKWQVLNGWDAVVGRVVAHNDSECCKYVGSYDTVNECAQAANKLATNLTGYTYYSSLSSASWARQCFAIMDGSWHPAPNASGVTSARRYSRNTWVADVSTVLPRGGTQIQGLRLNGRRLIRAKYPNGDPELSGNWFRVTSPEFGLGYYTRGWVTAPTQWLPPPSPLPPQRDLVVNALDWPDVEWPMNEVDNDTWTGMGDHGDFHIGVGGGCAPMGLPAGYWCAANPPRGAAYTHRAPTGVSLSPLPNAPYKNVTNAVVQAWRGQGRWYTWQFEVVKHDPETNMLIFSPTRGGNQGGEGAPVGDEWWIENVLEECDDANEWYHDAESGLLYMNFNQTSPADGDGDDVWEVPVHATVVRVERTKNITIDGVEIRDCRLTYLDTDTIGLPSGGDWAMHQVAAVVFGAGAENTIISNSYIHHCDGNGVFVGGGRVLAATIANNEMSWLGGSGVVLWGNTSTCMNANCSLRIPYTVGPDGRDGNYPQRTHVLANYIHEVGIYEKQSSMFFQAIATESVVARNVFVNGPRAGVNLNDGFGGGDVLSGNLIINMVRESGDHAPINTWNRLPYITTLRTGKPSIIPADRHIVNNAILATYASQLAVDNDDGSSRYVTSSNALVYGGAGLKSDFGGNHNVHHSNVYAYLGSSAYLLGGGAGTFDAFYNNTCVINRAGTGYQSDCLVPIGMKVRNNRIFTLDGEDSVCGMSLQQWVKDGHDFNTTIGVIPAQPDIIIGWLKSVLLF